MSSVDFVSENTHPSMVRKVGQFIDSKEKKIADAPDFMAKKSFENFPLELGDAERLEKYALGLEIEVVNLKTAKGNNPQKVRDLFMDEARSARQKAKKIREILKAQVKTELELR